VTPLGRWGTPGTRPRCRPRTGTNPLGGASSQARPIVIAAAVLGAAFVAWHVAVPAWPLRAQAQAGPCTLTAGREAELVAVDGTAEPLAVISATIGARCPPETRALNLVLLVDASPQTPGQTLHALQTVLEAAVRSVAIEARPSLQIGVISYAGDVRIEGQLSRSTDRTAAAIRNIRNRTGNCHSCGLAEAIRMLRAARGTRDATVLRDVVLLASAGDAVECTAVRQTANDARAYGVVVVTTCQGSNRDCGCMSEVAAQSRYVLQLATWEALQERLLDLVESRGIFHPIDEVVLVEALAPGFAYLDGGAPSGGIGNRLSWAFAPWSADAVTVAYRASAIACGVQPVAVAGESRAVARFNPSFGGVPDASVEVPNATLDVPCAIPTTPTPAAASATSTPTMSGTPSPTARTPTPMASPSPGRPPFRAYMPAALARGCARGGLPRDWLLVLDASYSMHLAEVPGAGNAWEASRAISLAVVGDLQPGSDRVGALAFGDGEPPDGFKEVPLAPCCSLALQEALAEGWRLDGSRADRALRHAIGMFGSGTMPRTVVLLTDGDLNQTPLGGLGGALSETRAAGAAIDVVVLGAEPDPRLIESVAAAGGRILRARERSPAELVPALARAVTCR